MGFYIVAVNAENEYDFAGAQVSWDVKHQRFRFYLLRHGEDRYVHRVGRDADQEPLRTWEELLAHAGPVLDWDDEETKKYMLLVEGDRRDDAQSDPNVKRIVKKLLTA